MKAKETKTLTPEEAVACDKKAAEVAEAGILAHIVAPVVEKKITKKEK